MAIELTDQNFDQEALTGDLPVLVDFYAPWCGPCRAMAPVLDELAKEVEGKAKVFKINVDAHGETSGKYGIMSIPALKIFKNGKVVKEFVGMQSKDALKSALLSA
ncbi:thioredoxin [Patescibacteria group bacterium]|nr:MAG: thioredoxin [Patescibacteria group bacterium]